METLDGRGERYECGSSIEDAEGVGTMNRKMKKPHHWQQALAGRVYAAPLSGQEDRGSRVLDPYMVIKKKNTVRS